MAPKKAASANVETVFSGAGKFTQEAESTGPTLLQRITKLHYNWKYPFLRAPNAEVVQRYKKYHGGNSVAMPVAMPVAGPSAAAAAEPAPAAPAEE